MWYSKRYQSSEILNDSNYFLLALFRVTQRFTSDELLIVVAAPFLHIVTLSKITFTFIEICLYTDIYMCNELIQFNKTMSIYKVQHGGLQPQIIIDHPG